MTTTVPSIDVSSVPTKVGIARTVDIPAMRYRQGDRTFYAVTLSIPDLVKVVEMPDPARPLADNRVVSEDRARKFGTEYVLSDEEPYGWVCPPIIVRVDPGELELASEVVEFDNGTSWVVLRISTTLLWLILDGQHRVFGFDIALKHCTERIRELRSLRRAAEENEQPEGSIRSLQQQLDYYSNKLEEMAQSHVSVTLVEATPDQGRQMFVDIARNAKGVNPDFTIVLDQRSVIHRIAIELSETHELLAGRVEHGQKSRMSPTNPHLLGAKAVADIVHGVIVGSGRVSKRREVDIARSESTYIQKAREFLDSLVAGFEDLNRVVKGELSARQLRENSLLGSATMLRVLAIVWHDLREGDEDTGIDPVPVGEIEAFFQMLSPHMAAFEEVEIVNPNNGDVTRKVGVSRENELWMSTDAFLPGSKAPSARQGDVKGLSRAIVQWARDGNESLD